uniref:Uncharacterized protein n=1 Tax=Dunaliella tertiolecta TaxID=3047 RepID=A0A7S3R679_DUNTE|mmetsp:Transcript_6924/g.18585  ORF Transcript_6924/g.18585 Transcript_6924/m.18585 type:complete len:406 (+) Transcript_6924:125-1342(+)|eukprot:CAMPEP_0202351392 /NCGR_PEP_ID=MMETSP1126-20121109/8054_1 /ASSEMBLY_ACC=CAM_ASM_000457 /TAXON_ID=3047 /ORGANISM="Dunaliella tertiolecta, Strain CCMP1320" /LENGTH=405 /DNA_ID=CAMNT_0048943497 /DNA_START=120 /DNA_END=1337 /DNA_ORIENTATION=-
MVSCRAVLLAGGFASDDSAPASPGKVGLLMTPRRRNFDRPKPSNKALEPFAGSMALVHIIQALSAAKRLQPLAESFSLVVNKCDLPLFYQTGNAETGDLMPELADMGLTSANIISNDAQSATEWLGELEDLQLAIRQIGSQLPVLALSAPAFTVLPGYNMQRIVEHSFIRNRDVIATRTWGPSDAALTTPLPASPQKKGSPVNTGLFSTTMEGDEMAQSGMHRLNGSLGASNGSGEHAHPNVALAHAADTTVMPPLRSIELGVTPYLGDVIAEPILLLKAASIASVVAPARGPYTTLVEFASRNHQLSLHSIDVGPGYIPLAHSSCEYARRWMTFFKENCRPSGNSFLQQGPVEHLSNEFNKLFFGHDVMQQDGEIKRVPGLSDFKLPSTFYMTQYRRQAADAMR